MKITYEDKTQDLIESVTGLARWLEENDYYRYYTTKDPANNSVGGRHNRHKSMALAIKEAMTIRSDDYKNDTLHHADYRQRERLTLLRDICDHILDTGF